MSIHFAYDSKIMAAFPDGFIRHHLTNARLYKAITEQAQCNT